MGDQGGTGDGKALNKPAFLKWCDGKHKGRFRAGGNIKAGLALAGR